MTLMAWLWIGLSILGAIVLAVVVWLAGPLVSIGDVQPFDSARSEERRVGKEC